MDVAKLQLRLCADAGVCLCGGSMKCVRADGLSVFALYFGLAVIQAFQTHDWIKAAFWLVMGSGFLLADNLRRRI